MAKAQGVSQLTQERLRRGVFHSVPELVAAIEAYLQHYKREPHALRLDRDRRRHPREDREVYSHS